MNFGLVANIMAVGMSMITFLPVPSGSGGRPMALTGLLLLFGLIMTPLGLMKAVPAWAKEKSHALAAMVLSLGILPVGLLTFFMFATAKAFELEP